jgi:hypothetical protein
MPFGDKHPARLTEADLMNLIGAEPEGKSIDYKRDLVAQGDGDKKEFLYDARAVSGRVESVWIPKVGKI